MNKKDLSIRAICERSWDENYRLTDQEIQKILSVKRYKIRTDLAVRSTDTPKDFLYTIDELSETIDGMKWFYSVIYLWNGKGYSALRPFCTCHEDEMHPDEMHPIHITF